MPRKHVHAVGAVLSAQILLASPAQGQVPDPPSVAAETEAEVAAGTPAAAATSEQTATPAGSAAVQVYLPADFAAFAPRNALDMVKQVPGFSVNEGRGGGGGGGGGGGQSRGLGQATGNVLLNGERIVTKSDSIEDQLARIPADDVTRIELVEGSTLNIPGLSGRVANIIASSTGGVQGQFEWRPQIGGTYSDDRWLEGIISMTGSFGNWSFGAAVEGRPNRGGSGGLNRFTYFDGTVEDRFSVAKNNGNDKRLSGNVRYSGDGGFVANLSSSYLHRRFHSREDESVLVPRGQPGWIERIRTRSGGHDFELGGDVDFALGPGRMKLIGLESSADFTTRTEAVIDPGTGAPSTGTRFAQYSEKGERIGRGEYSVAMLGGDWQVSAEAAFNRLDLVGALFRLSPAGDFVSVPFPSGTGGVREDRYEALISHGRSLTSNLSLQIIAGAEHSTLTQSGSDANARSFLRPKGSISLAWTPDEGLDISLRIERRIGQLNFSDFLAAVNISDDNQNASNNELRPDISLGKELQIAKDFGAWGSANLRLFHRNFTDYITIVPTATGGEARGNVDSARIMGMEFNGTVRFDPLGLPGAKLDVVAELRDSRFEDPVERVFIPVPVAQPSRFEFNFRHDVAGSDWAYGAGFRRTRFNPYYRVAEFGYDYNMPENVDLFVEHKNVLGLTVQVRVNRLFGSRNVLDRQIFAGPRGTAPLVFREYRVRDMDRVVNLTIKGSI